MPKDFRKEMNNTFGGIPRVLRQLPDKFLTDFIVTFTGISHGAASSHTF